jgi:dihydropteroate synthase
MTDLVQTWSLANGRELTIERPRVLGILNVTPDSFSDGGLLASIDDAVRGGERLVAEGADMLDVGAESTRPGAERVGAREQIERAGPVIQALRRALPHVAISIDTTLAPVAEAALGAGADAVNDVSAGTEDAALIPLVARRGAGLVLMHRLTDPARDRYSHAYPREPDYTAHGGVVPAVRAFLAERLRAALDAGVARDRIVLDPGLGFGKSVAQNLELIARTGELLDLGRPVLSALSRKSFTARAAGLPDSTPPRDRVHASVGLSCAHLAAGARLFRVHDVRAHAQALRAAWTASHAPRI